MTTASRIQTITSATSTTLLQYAIESVPNPLQVSPATGDPSVAAITIVASAPVGTSVTVTHIAVTLPTGSPSAPDATDLTEQPPAQTPAAVDTNGLAWSVTPSPAAGTWIIEPPNGPQTLSSDALTITIGGITVSPIVGTATISIIETANDGGGIKIGTQTFTVPKFPYGFTAGNFAASEPIVENGQTVTLTWNGSSNATYTLLSGANPGVDVSNVDSYVTPPLTETTTYILSVTAQTTGQSVTLYFMLTVVVSDPDLVADALTVTNQTVLLGPSHIVGVVQIHGEVLLLRPYFPFELSPPGQWIVPSDGYVWGTAGPPSQGVACLASGQVIGAAGADESLVYIATGGTVAMARSDGTPAWGPLYGTFTMPVSGNVGFTIQVWNDPANEYPITARFWYVPLGTEVTGNPQFGIAQDCTFTPATVEIRQNN